MRDLKVVKILPEGKYSYNPALRETIKVIPLLVVKENTVAVVTKNGTYAQTLPPGTHFVNQFNLENAIIVAATIIGENERGIRTNKGRFEEVLGPGQHFENPALDIKIQVKPITIIEEGHVGL